MEKFQDVLDKRDLQLSKTPFQENYLTVERLMRKHLPTQLWNRRVWGGELEEWNIIKRAAPVGNNAESEKPVAKKPVPARPAKSNGKPKQMALF